MNTELDNIFILQAIIKGSKKAHQSLNSSVTIPMMMVRPEVCRSILHTLELEAAYLLCTLPWVAEMIRHLYDYHWQFYVAFDARIWCFSSIPTRNITCFWFGQTWNSPELSNLKILTRTLIPQLWFFPGLAISIFLSEEECTVSLLYILLHWAQWGQGLLANYSVTAHLLLLAQERKTTYLDSLLFVFLTLCG